MEGATGDSHGGQTRGTDKMDSHGGEPLGKTTGAITGQGHWGQPRRQPQGTARSPGVWVPQKLEKTNWVLPGACGRGEGRAQPHLEHCPVRQGED